MDVIASFAGAAGELVIAAAEAGEEPAAFQINLFWVVMQALSFLLFLAILYVAAFRRVGGVLEARRSAIEQGLRDAEQARRDREGAAAERVETLAEARREANDILARAQKVAQETRDADIAATREELDRMRARATDEIEAEKHRALAELRGEVADLALLAATKVVRDTMTGDRQRRLVEEFLSEAGSASNGGSRT